MTTGNITTLWAVFLFDRFLRPLTTGVFFGASRTVCTKIQTFSLTEKIKYHWTSSCGERFCYVFIPPTIHYIRLVCSFISLTRFSASCYFPLGKQHNQSQHRHTDSLCSRLRYQETRHCSLLNEGGGQLWIASPRITKNASFLCELTESLLCILPEGSTDKSALLQRFER